MAVFTTTYPLDTSHRREMMILLASNRFIMKKRERQPTDYEMISGQVSFYESANSPDLMPELSPNRVCFVCSHPWNEHGDDGCKGVGYRWVSEDDRIPERCICRKQL